MTLFEVLKIEDTLIINIYDIVKISDVSGINIQPKQVWEILANTVFKKKSLPNKITTVNCIEFNFRDR